MAERKIPTKLIVAVVVAIAIVIGGIAAYYYYAIPKPPPAPKEITIGLIQPLTGYYAVFGIEARQGAELAIEFINAEGGIKALGNAKLKLVVEDSAGTPEGARLAAEKLIAEHHPPIILGAYISKHTLALSEITEKYKVILFMDALADYLVERGLRYIFRPLPPATIYGASAVDFLYDIGKKTGKEATTIAIVNEDSIFGRYVSLGAYKRALDLGLTVVHREEYPYDAVTLAPVVTKLIEAKPDAVVFVPYFADSILMAKTIKEMGFEAMALFGAGACGFADDDSVKAGGEAVEYFTNTYTYNLAKKTAANKKFLDEFKARFGKLPADAGGEMHYMVWVVKEALELSGQLHPDKPLDPDSLRDVILKLDITAGPAAELDVSGRIAFDERGERKYGKTCAVQVIGGKRYVVWPFAEADRDPVYPRP